MKTLLKLSALLVLPMVVMAANGNHPMAGCGLGYLLLSHDDNSKGMQILGATTNGTFGSQTFGITSGTSGCTEDGAVKLAKATEVFASVNLQSLRQEIAQGSGEYVQTFASLLGASDEKNMVGFLQSQYGVLFPKADTSAEEMLSSLSLSLASHPELLS